MKKYVSKLTALLCGVAMTATMLTGCSSGQESAESASSSESPSVAASEDASENAAASESAPAASDVVLEVETGWTGEMLDGLQALMDQFTEETGIGVELIAPGDDYENVMKTRMASGDLPDLWETHGWSTTRYAEYLTPLNDEPWMAKVKESIKKTVTDPAGNVYVAPLSIDPASICYNKDIFDEAGVDAASIRTWADFEAACDKILAVGKVPVYVGGKTIDNIANLFEVMAPGFLTNEDVAENQEEALLNGSFDWSAYWTPMAEQLDKWLAKGYFNPDILTASDDSAIQALANGEGAIVISGNHTIVQALTYNPDARLGIMAIPSPYEGGKLYVSSGEGSCYGMWKDTEYPDECRKLLEFLTRDDISVQVATINGKIPAMEGVSNDEEYVTNEFNIMMDTFGDDLLFVSYFDRAYLPSGMWNDMGVSGNEIFMNPGQGVEKCVETIKTAYEEKLNQ